MIIIKGIHSPDISLPVDVIAKHENTRHSFQLRADFDLSSVSRMYSARLYDSRQEYTYRRFGLHYYPP
jgi:hypothetical protein